MSSSLATHAAKTPVASSAQPQRLACVAQVLHGLTVGGAEVLAARMARSLSDRYRFAFYCLDELGPLGEELKSEGFPVTLLSRRLGIDPGCGWRLGNLLREHQVDLIHAHQYTPYFYSALARTLRKRIPLLFTEHGRWYPDYPRRKRMIYNRLMLRPHDRIVGVGETVKRALIDNEGFPQLRAQMIYNGIDLTPYVFQGKEVRDQVRRELQLEDGDLALVQVARLDGLKNHPLAVRTMARVAARLPHAQLLIVGEGPERGRIEKEITAEGVYRQVRLLGERRDIPRLLAAADICLLTSKSEGIPLTLIEGMAAGLPVISTRVGGVPEVVVNGLCGILCEHNDAEALADGVFRLASSESLRKSMGEQGRERARREFAEAKMHDRYAALYEEMLHG